MPGPGSSFADRLNYLFDVLRPPQPAPDADQEPEQKANPKTGEFSHAYVAKTISEYGMGTLSEAYIGQLRKKDEKNPSIRVARLFARFFGVPAAFFAEDDGTVAIVEQFQLVQALKEKGVQNLAMRAVGLSPASTDALLKMAEAARQMEGLPSEPQILS
ncbi:hypothetical protein [Streptomyces sp. WAC05292]|uniref:hypothetical protein n=1 Tax=Streptomyces sp. WAC05292 TaxID=2487418 RepID=UPI0021AFE226|nr:hypothetical protein [Streptomyces sp. WAC05292]